MKSWLESITQGKHAAARYAVLKAAWLNNGISLADARRIGNWAQPQYHLGLLCRAGLLERAGYNRYVVGIRSFDIVEN